MKVLINSFLFSNLNYSVICALRYLCNDYVTLYYELLNKSCLVTIWLPLRGEEGGGLSQKQTAANGDGGQPNVDVRSGKNYFHFFTIISK